MRFPPLLALCLLGAGAIAQPADPAWLESQDAAEFRARVVQLGLIYGESSGIDPRDFKVATRAVPQPPGGCADVEVVTSKRSEVVRRETVHACRAH